MSGKNFEVQLSITEPVEGGKGEEGNFAGFDMRFPYQIICMETARLNISSSFQVIFAICRIRLISVKIL